MSGFIRKKCGYCEGTGEVDVGEQFEDLVVCPICWGNGLLAVPSNYHQCISCGGSGKIGEKKTEYETCKICCGKGWAP